MAEVPRETPFNVRFSQYIHEHTPVVDRSAVQKEWDSLDGYDRVFLFDRAQSSQDSTYVPFTLSYDSHKFFGAGGRTLTPYEMTQVAQLGVDHLMGLYTQAAEQRAIVAYLLHEAKPAELVPTYIYIVDYWYRNVINSSERFMHHNVSRKGMAGTFLNSIISRRIDGAIDDSEVDSIIHQFTSYLDNQRSDYVHQSKERGALPEHLYAWNVAVRECLRSYFLRDSPYKTPAENINDFRPIDSDDATAAALLITDRLTNYGVFRKSTVYEFTFDGARSVDGGPLRVHPIFINYLFERLLQENGTDYLPRKEGQGSRYFDDIHRLVLESVRRASNNGSRNAELILTAMMASRPSTYLDIVTIANKLTQQINKAGGIKVLDESGAEHVEPLTPLPREFASLKQSFGRILNVIYERSGEKFMSDYYAEDSLLKDLVGVIADRGIALKQSMVVTTMGDLAMEFPNLEWEDLLKIRDKRQKKAAYGDSQDYYKTQYATHGKRVFWNKWKGRKGGILR